MIEKQKVGFKYTFEVVKDGCVVDTWDCENLMPIEGLNHVLNVLVKQGTQVPTWYLGLYENDYTPQPTDTMSTLPGLAGEVTQYAGSNRLAFNAGAVAGGAVSNTAAKAEFVFNAVKSVRGGFLSSSPTKGTNSGVLLSVVRFKDGAGNPVVKELEPDAVLRITGGLELVSS